LTKKIQIHYLPPLKSKNYEIISKKFDASNAFQKYQKHNPNFLYIYIYIYIYIIYNNFCTISLNITKPLRCTCTYQRFSNIAKSIMRGIVVWEISMWQTNKTNKFPFLIIDRWHVMLAKLWTHCSINVLFKNQNL
jgi:hypothetical protein